MSGIFQLWLPILVTAVLIFMASSLIHMIFKWHNSDYRKLTNEDDVRAVMRAGSPLPGQYVLPHCTDMKDMQGDAMQKKFVEGPNAFVTIRKNGPPTMGAALSLWFVYCIIIATIAGAMAMQIYGPGASASVSAGLSIQARAAQLIGLMSFLAFTGGSIQMGIWMGKPWGSVAKDALDGFIYAVISTLVFMWLWP